MPPRGGDYGLLRENCPHTCLDVHDGVDVAGVHLAQSCEIKGDIVSEHDRVDVLLEDGVALDLEDIESDIAAAQKSLGSLNDLGDLLVVVVDDEDGVELVLVVVVVPSDDLVVVELRVSSGKVSIEGL